MSKPGAILTTLLLTAVILLIPGLATADDDLWPPMPGAAVKGGYGLFQSVPCRCFDRRVANFEVSARLHFGDRGAVEADLQQGVMLLGGNFPSSGWSVGGRLTVLPPLDRWWDNLSVRLGYRHWQTMGMRSRGAPGVYSAANWAVEVFPHVYLESDLLVSRVFRDMPHWEFGARLGVATRF